MLTKVSECVVAMRSKMRQFVHSPQTQVYLFSNDNHHGAHGVDDDRGGRGDYGGDDDDGRRSHQTNNAAGT
jgi:hypothetical protein